MRNSIIRITNVEINNLKNIEHGEIKIKQNLNHADIIGIYGQNGSGKTAFVDAMAIVKSLMNGSSIDDNSISLINDIGNDLNIKISFSAKIKDINYLLYYDVSVNNEGAISKETLSYKIIELDSISPLKKLLSYDSLEKVKFLRTKEIYDILRKANTDNEINLHVTKRMVQTGKSSFIFNNEFIKMLKNIDNSEIKLVKLLVEYLQFYSRFNLIVIPNSHSGFININGLMKMHMRMNIDHSITRGVFSLDLSKSTLLTNEQLSLLNTTFTQINTVLSCIIPGLNIETLTLGTELDESGIENNKVELVSVRDTKKIPIRYESDGIKKIISILNSIISMYNNPSICVIIDELDAGIYEYLLGELLEILHESAKGQLFFTSHNLRPLEKLDKDSIIFTTTNPKNKYYRFRNVKANNNLRDLYYRGIILGGQNECIYDETKSYSIRNAFRKAGQVYE